MPSLGAESPGITKNTKTNKRQNKIQVGGAGNREESHRAALPHRRDGGKPGLGLPGSGAISASATNLPWELEKVLALCLSVPCLHIGLELRTSKFPFRRSTQSVLERERPGGPAYRASTPAALTSGEFPDVLCASVPSAETSSDQLPRLLRGGTK